MLVCPGADGRLIAAPAPSAKKEDKSVKKDADKKDKDKNIRKPKRLEEVRLTGVRTTRPIRVMAGLGIGGRGGEGGAAREERRAPARQGRQAGRQARGDGGGEARAPRGRAREGPPRAVRTRVRSRKGTRAMELALAMARLSGCAWAPYTNCLRLRSLGV